MAGRSAEREGPLARGAYWLTTVHTTLVFGTVLSAVFLVELWVWERFGFETFAWLFVADIAPSPAWVLAAFAHSPLRPLHLVANLLVLVVFGGMVERRLDRGEYLAFLVIAGLVTTLAGVFVTTMAGGASSPFGALGASGTTLAATACAVVASVRRKLTTGEWDGETTWIWVVAGVAVLGRRLALDFLVGASGAGRYGHLCGALFGVGYALVRVSEARTDGTDGRADR